MTAVKFSKLSGSGNDFILIDNREKIFDTDNCADFVSRVCKRALSVGADGVIFIENDPERTADFMWRFFNADGSQAAMCGNGGRCAARYAHWLGIAGEIMTFRTGAGIIRGEITGEKAVKLQLTEPKGYLPLVKLNIDDKWYEGKFLDTGVPHLVIEVDDIKKVDVKTLGSIIRFHDQFKPAGANANFVQASGAHSLFIRTYERGVEDETLACGTGAVAAAITMAKARRVKAPVMVTTQSGETLTVSFDLNDNDDSNIPKRVFFEGDVTWVYDGVLKKEGCD